MSNLPALNLELLADVITWAVADERQIQELKAKYPDWGDWNQGSWANEVRNGVCQTSYCIAGQAVVQVGMGIAFPEGDDMEGFKYGDAYHLTGSLCAPKKFSHLDDKGKPVYVLDKAHLRSIPDVAREALGLTATESSNLFEGSNSIETVVTMAVMFADVRGVKDQFMARLPYEVVEVLDEAWDGDIAKGYRQMVDRLWWPSDYPLPPVARPVDVREVLTEALESRRDYGDVSDRQFEVAYEWLMDHAPNEYVAS